MTIQANFPNVQPSLLLDFANAKQLPPSVNFTRATTAAYYDGSTTAKAEQNFFFYSQDFSQAAWAVNGATKTSTTQTDPAGGSTALLLTKVTDDGYSLRQYSGGPNPAGKTFTFSVYLKGASAGSLRLFVDNGVNQSFTSDISITTSWVRYTLTTGTFNSTTAYLTAGIALLSGSVTSVNVAFAQIEERSSATAYTATTTQPITNYIPVLLTAGGGQPRFDHNPTTSESLGLLIEEQRTNVGLYSSDFSNATWAKGNSTIDADTIVAPDGTLTGDKLVETTATGSHNIVQNYTGTATLTASVYAKPSGRSIFVFNGGNQSGVAATFNVSSGTVSSVGGAVTATSITPVGNGWYRCSMTWSNTSTVGLGIFLESGGSTSYTGDGFSGLFIWGAQIETGSFPTSYIPTTSASATRAQDLASMTGNNLTSWFNNAQGTLYIDGARFGTNLYPRFAGFYSENTENYSMGIGQWSASTVSFYGVNGTTQFDVSRAPSGLTYGSQIRAAGAYAVNNVGLSANGTATSVDTDATIPYIDAFYIGGGVNPALNGWLKKVAYYPVRVTDAQLQALTT